MNKKNNFPKSNQTPGDYQTPRKRKGGEVKKKIEKWWCLSIEDGKGNWVPCHWAAKTKKILRINSDSRVWPERNKCYRYKRTEVYFP